MLDTWCFYIIQLDFNFKIIFKLEYIHYLNEIFFLIFNAKINLILKILKIFYSIFQLKSRNIFFLTKGFLIILSWTMHNFGYMIVFKIFYMNIFLKVVFWIRIWIYAFQLLMKNCKFQLIFFSKIKNWL